MENANVVVGALGICGYTAHYQPIVARTEDNPSIVGYEALCRRYSGNRILTGDEIVRTAKEDNTLSFVDSFMAMLNLAIRPSVPAENFLSINVSAKTLIDRGFVNSILHSNVTNQSMILEITETEPLRRDEIKLLVENTRRLSAKGWQFAIDDFGDGMDCWRYLNLLSIDLVKIPRSALMDIKTIGQSKIQLWCDLVYSFNRQKILTVLEGVENEEDVAVARDLNVDFMQGYLFGRPSNANIPGRLAGQLTPFTKTSL